MKKLLICAVCVLSLFSCSKYDNICKVAINYDFVSNDMPTKSDYTASAINSALRELNPMDVELSLNGIKFHPGDEISLYEGTYQMNLLYNPCYEDNWFGNREVFPSFYINGYTCNIPSFYINDAIKVVKGIKNYTLSAHYNCCAFVFDKNVIDSCKVVYYFPNFTEADFEVAEPWYSWTPKLSEKGDLRIFFLNEFSEYTNQYTLELYKNGKAITVPITYGNAYLGALNVERGKYYLLNYNREVNIGFDDWTAGEI